MQTDTTRQAASAIFAANRARGAVRFDVHGADGVTRRRELHESGSLRVRFPSPEDEGLSAVFVNTAGGIAGGDRFDIDIAAGEGCAADGHNGGGGKDLPREWPGRGAQRRPEGRGGARIWPGCRRRRSCSTGRGCHRRFDIDLADRRLASALRNRGVRPRRDGRAHAAGRISRSLARSPRRQAGLCRNRRLDGDIGGKLAQPAIAKGGVAIGTALIVPGDEALVERIRELAASSAARSASPHGMDLQWRASVPKMRPGFAPT